MVLFITVQIFQWMFNAQIAGDALIAVRLFGFFELRREYEW